MGMVLQWPNLFLVTAQKQCW